MDGGVGGVILGTFFLSGCFRQENDCDALGTDKHGLGAFLFVFSVQYQYNNRLDFESNIGSSQVHHMKNILCCGFYIL